MRYTHVLDGIEAAGIELDLRRMQLPRNLEARYGALVEAALAEMRDLEAGGFVNTDENRQVGHYWLRNPDAAPEAFREPIRKVFKEIRRFHDERFRERFVRILWIGIGGSGLGPQMLYDALRKPGTTPAMFFFDNTDPEGFQRTLEEIGPAGLAKTLAVVVSKSGTTPETHNGMRVAQRAYEKESLAFGNHAVAITEQGSELDETAKRAGWLASFPMWDWVGGRTSLFSAVGILPAQLLGFDVDELCKGAQAMDEATSPSRRELECNPALCLAAAWYHAVETLGLRNMVVLPYCDRLATLSKYLQQLIMESLGKNGKGITVYGNKGSTDQHSYIQQLREGCRDFFVTFLRVIRPQVDWELEGGVTVGDYLAAFQEGTAEALSSAGRLSMRLTIDQLDARRLGAIVALFERAVGYYGAMLGINPYHQPGVEAGKKAARSILAIQRELVGQLRRHGTMSVKELSKAVRAPEPLVYDLLDRLVRCDRFGLAKDAARAGKMADVRFGPRSPG